MFNKHLVSSMSCFWAKTKMRFNFKRWFFSNLGTVYFIIRSFLTRDKFFWETRFIMHQIVTLSNEVKKCTCDAKRWDYYNDICLILSRSTFFYYVKMLCGSWITLASKRSNHIVRFFIVSVWEKKCFNLKKICSGRNLFISLFQIWRVLVTKKRPYERVLFLCHTLVCKTSWNAVYTGEIAV